MTLPADTFPLAPSRPSRERIRAASEGMAVGDQFDQRTRAEKELREAKHIIAELEAENEELQRELAWAEGS